MSSKMLSARRPLGLCPPAYQPATDIDAAEYRELLYQTGTKRPTLTRPWIDPAGDALVVDKLDEVLDLLDRKQPVKVQSKQQLTRIFSDPFSEVFS